MGMKPSREENELQPLAPETDAITRDLVGETHPKPMRVDEPDTQVYIVQPGDTLGGIAKRFYNDENQFHRIIAANRDRLDDNDSAAPGTELRIPPA